MQNKASRRCDFCNIDVHRASFAKHLKSIKHFENEKVFPLTLSIKLMNPR